MPNKIKSIKFPGALLSYRSCFLLLILGLMLYAAPRPANAGPAGAGADLSANTDPAAETNCECASAEINVKGDSMVRAGLLYDLAADAIVWEKNKNQACPIASLTKTMVALIAMEDVYAGKVDLDSTVRVTPEAAKMTGSKVYLKTGCCVSVEELLKAALISSGNDAAYLLAEFLGGSADAFVHRMNTRAAQLGMKNTHYSNPTGLPAPQSCDDNHASPEDLLLLVKEMLKYDQLLEIAGTSADVITQDQKIIKLRNHNHLVSIYSEVDGLKTGFTQNAKYCLIATANKNNRRLIAIALGVENRDRRNQFVAGLINHYYEALGMGELERKGGGVQQCVAKNSIPAATPKKASAVLRAEPAHTVHIVRKGDTLYKVSKKYGCTLAQLKSWNHLTDSWLDPGQELTIRNTHGKKSIEQEKDDEDAVPDVQAAADTPEPNHARVHIKKETERASASSREKFKSHVIQYYTVRPGDTLWTISQKYDGISVQDIMKANRIRRSKSLKPGTTLKIVLNA